MTKTEKINAILSVTALFVSLLTPIATYIWLDVSQKDFIHRGRFMVTNSDENLLSRGEQATVPVTVAIKNIGDRPADNVQISATYSGKKPPEKPFFIRGPVAFEVKQSDNIYFFKLITPIPAGESVALHFDKAVTNAFITTKYGDTVTIWGNGFLGGGSSD